MANRTRDLITVNTEVTVKEKYPLTFSVYDLPVKHKTENEFQKIVIVYVFLSFFSVLNTASRQCTFDNELKMSKIQTVRGYEQGTTGGKWEGT